MLPAPVIVSSLLFAPALTTAIKPTTSAAARVVSIRFMRVFSFSLMVLWRTAAVSGRAGPMWAESR